MKTSSKVILLSIFVLLVTCCGNVLADCLDVCNDYNGSNYETCMIKCRGDENTHLEKQCPEGMAYIPAGEFMMGCSPGDDKCDNNESPSKIVVITKGFCMDKTEVTQGAYQETMGENPSEFKECGENCPVEQVDWDDAKGYCEKTGKRLPTEAEWEYAARGGTTTKYFWGNTEDSAYAWYDRNSHPVAKKKPNANGLYDVLGNVWEWVEDCDDDDWYSRMPKRDPLNTCTDHDLHVLRGGFWCPDGFCMQGRISERLSIHNFSSGDGGGFRCALSLSATLSISANVEGFKVDSSAKSRVDSAQ